MSLLSFSLCIYAFTKYFASVSFCQKWTASESGTWVCFKPSVSAHFLYNFIESPRFFVSLVQNSAIMIHIILGVLILIPIVIGKYDLSLQCLIQERELHFLIFNSMLAFGASVTTNTFSGAHNMSHRTSTTGYVNFAVCTCFILYFREGIVVWWAFIFCHLYLIRRRFVYIRKSFKNYKLQFPDLPYPLWRGPSANIQQPDTSSNVGL